MTVPARRGESTGPTHSIGRDAGGPDSSSWRARPALATALRVVAAGLPIAVGVGVALTVNLTLPPAGHVVTAIARCLAVVGASTLAVWAVDRVARRVLPLATLMRLSLVFPDQAPNRFKVALRSGSSRNLAANTERVRRHGLDQDPALAAAQVVELITAIGAHDRRTRGHSERVRLFADLVGEEMHLPPDERQRLQWGALIHDLGKLTVPPEILNKAGRPTEEEWAVLSHHPIAGEELVEPLRPMLGEWVGAVGGHHEKWDGSGYPRGLAGAEISRAAAIVAVADAFEVMTAVRSYKRAMPIADARAELTRCAGTHFSPEVVRAFLSISIRRLRLAGGPLAALAHLPFVETIANSSVGSAVVGQAVGRVAAAIPTVAAGVVTGSLVISAAGPVSAEFERPVVAAAVSGQGGSTGGSRSSGGGSGGDGAVSNGGTASESDGSTSGGGTVDGDDPSSSSGGSGGAGGAADPTAGGGTGGATDGGSGGAVTGDTTTTVTDGGSATTSTVHATTTTARATTTVAPTTTAAPVTSAPTTTVPGPVNPVLMVSTSPERTNAQPLQGASLAVGSSVYVFIWTSSTYSSVDFWKSLVTLGNADLTDSSAPFDLAGTNTNGTAKPTTVPLLGLSVTAKFHGPGPSATISASSSIL